MSALKNTVGHLESAAGAAALLKVLWQLLRNTDSFRVLVGVNEMHLLTDRVCKDIDLLAVLAPRHS